MNDTTQQQMRGQDDRKVMPRFEKPHPRVWQAAAYAGCGKRRYGW